jgi:hypothetical protein
MSIGEGKELKKIDEKVWLIEREDGLVLLVKYYYPCPHRNKDGDYSRHIHFYITTKDKVDTDTKLYKLLDWLDSGFWRDSCIWSSVNGVRQLAEQFLKYECTGALQPF